ncbi:MAG: PIN domain-containing protein [Archaeoglobi archaeon]|nr:PIN domain-containing protein [Candidatus Mnemosynella bozhongmuii]
MKVFFDTNFLVSLIVETEFSERARKVLESYIDSDFITSINVLEEVSFILRKLMKMRNEDMVEKLRKLLEGLEIEVIEHLPLEEFFEVLREYPLLPNDALIAATCRYYGIRRIATFDEDFKRVDFLEIITEGF